MKSWKATYKKLYSLGDIADAHWKLELVKRDIEETLRGVKEDMAKYEQDAIELAELQENILCRGKLADGVVETKEHVNIADRAVLDKWVVKTGRTEIMQGRVSSTVYRELTEHGVTVPGVKIFKEKKFRTKARGGKK